MNIEFNQLQWVLVRDTNKSKWSIAQYSHYDDDTTYKHVTCGGKHWLYCIPYKNNKHLVGTTNNPKNLYELKDGDFLFLTTYNGIRFIFIKKYGEYKTSRYASLLIDRGFTNYDYNGYCVGDECIKEIRTATDKERQKLLDALHEHGKDWDITGKKIIDFIGPYKPKDGEFVFAKGVDTHLFILKENSCGSLKSYVELRAEERLRYSSLVALTCNLEVYRPATEEEKQKLLDALHKVGKGWDADKKKIVDWKWEPKKGETYYYPYFNTVLCNFVPSSSTWSSDSTDLKRNEFKLVCRTIEECGELCDKLTTTIRNVTL